MEKCMFNHFIFPTTNRAWFTNATLFLTQQHFDRNSYFKNFQMK